MQTKPLQFCVLVLVVAVVAGVSLGRAQDLGYTFFPDGYGEVEQATYILASSDSNEIDTFTVTENMDFTGEDIEYVGARGILYDGNHIADFPSRRLWIRWGGG